jgi:hypothetical protein
MAINDDRLDAFQFSRRDFNGVIPGAPDKVER